MSTLATPIVLYMDALNSIANLDSQTANPDKAARYRWCVAVAGHALWPDVIPDPGSFDHYVAEICAGTTVSLDTGIGELFDRLSILTIKSQRIKGANLEYVERELQVTAAACTYLLQNIADFQSAVLLADSLRRVNSILWEVEDEIRACEHSGVFDAVFVNLARSVYRLNDMRAVLKREIGVLFGSKFLEVKSYTGWAT